MVLCPRARFARAELLYKNSLISHSTWIREEKCDVKLPWWPFFWMTAIGPILINDDGDSNENGQKKTDSQNNNFPRASHVHFFAVDAPLRYGTS